MIRLELWTWSTYLYWLWFFLSIPSKCGRWWRATTTQKHSKSENPSWWCEKPGRLIQDSFREEKGTGRSLKWLCLFAQRLWKGKRHSDFSDTDPTLWRWRATYSKHDDSSYTFIIKWSVHISSIEQFKIDKNIYDWCKLVVVETREHPNHSRC